VVPTDCQGKKKGAGDWARESVFGSEEGGQS